jgi:hypothetical protein
MGDTKLISLRIPEDVLLAVDAMAEAEHRSRAAVIVMTLRDNLPGPATVRVPQPRPIVPRGKPRLRTDAVGTTGGKVTIATAAVEAIGETVVSLSTLQTRKMCPKCDGSLTPWSPGQVRCMNCRQNWPEII